MKLSEATRAFATRYDRKGYPWWVRLADWITGHLVALGL